MFIGSFSLMKIHLQSAKGGTPQKSYPFAEPFIHIKYNKPYPNRVVSTRLAVAERSEIPKKKH